MAEKPRAWPLIGSPFNDKVGLKVLCNQRSRGREAELIAPHEREQAATLQGELKQRDVRRAPRLFAYGDEIRHLTLRAGATPGYMEAFADGNRVTHECRVTGQQIQKRRDLVGVRQHIVDREHA